MRPRPVLAAVLAAAALATGCATGGEAPLRPRPEHPETWPPTNATECLRARPPGTVDPRRPAALAVRDWEQPVVGGVVEAVLCARPESAFPPGERPLVATLRGVEGVVDVAPSGARWSGRDDLVVPVTARADGPGRIEVVIGREEGPERTAGAGPSPALVVDVVPGEDGLVAREGGAQARPSADSSRPTGFSSP